MKRYQIILILAFIPLCFSDTEPDQCEIDFEAILKQKCLDIAGSSCSFDSGTKQCIDLKPCSAGNDKTPSECQEIVPPTFTTQKCELKDDGKTCEAKSKLCSDYNKIGYGSTQKTISGDTCSSLTAPSDQGNGCILKTESSCIPHFDECRKIVNTLSNYAYLCNNNLPNDHLTVCEWETPTNGGAASCAAKERYCEEYLYQGTIYHSKDICTQLNIETEDTEKSKKSCIYGHNNECKKEYKECKDHPLSSFGSPTKEEQCKSFIPLNQRGTDYDYLQRCFYNQADDECQPTNRKCTELDGIPNSLLNEEMCEQLEVSKSYYRCAFKETTQQCYEEFISCETYTTYKVETDRNTFKSGCEGIKLKNQNEKCVYDIKEDKCEKKQIYEKCEDYKGKDKKTCESIILSPISRPTCILDKDSTCIERPLFCSEAYSEDDCLKRAKANDNNKGCAWKWDDSTTKISGKCYEEYIRCEDWISGSIGSTGSYCNDIKLYDGKFCRYESSSTSTSTIGRCRTYNKVCSDTDIEEECKLIAKTGVSDPERKICAYIGNSCVETYKYCSDYREICASGDNSCETFCKNIKPYDESGNDIDISSKCIYDVYGCQKVPVECEDASGPIECESFNQYIKDKDKKYCVYYDGDCKTYYKNCEDVEEYESNPTKCTNNIIEGYLTGLCIIEDDKCIRKKTCSSFVYSTYKELCNSISPNCTYTSSDKCQFIEKTCSDIKFYSGNEEDNKKICENSEVDSPYKKCVLKEDKSGCEVIYRELSFSTSYSSYSAPTENEEQGDSSNYVKYGIHLIILILSLLF